MRTNKCLNSKAWSIVTARVGRVGNSISLMGLTRTLRDMGFRVDDQVTVAILNKDYEVTPVFQAHRKEKEKETEKEE